MRLTLILLLWLIVATGALGCGEVNRNCVIVAMQDTWNNNQKKPALTYAQAKEVCGVK